MSKGGGGGLFSSGAKTSSNSLEQRNLLNFAPFQQPAIDAIFGALTPEIFQVPQSATNATNAALSNAQGLLGRISQFDPLGDLQGVRDIVNEDISKERFNEVQNIFKDIFRGSGSLFGNELNRNFAERAVGLLSPTAEGRFLPGQDLANRFFEPGVVEPALDDARNQIATLFSGSGRLNSPSAAQTVARETGRISGGLRSNQFQFERGLQQNAQTGIGQLDTAEGVRRLNAISGQTNAQLGATQGIQNAIAAEEQRRQNLLGIRSGLSGQQLGLQSGLINALPALASQQAQLPFVPLTAGSNIAFQPLGQSGTIATNSTSRQTSSPSLFNTVAGLGLTAAGLGAFDGGGLFGGFGKGATSAATGAPGFGRFASNIGPLASPVAPIASTPFLPPPLQFSGIPF